MNANFNNNNKASNYSGLSNNTNSNKFNKKDIKRSSESISNYNSKQIKVESSNSSVRVKEEVVEEITIGDIGDDSFIFGEISSSGNIRVKDEQIDGQLNQPDNNSNSNDQNILEEDNKEEEADPFDDLSLLDDLSFLEQEFNQLETPSQILNSQTYLRLTILEKTSENFLNSQNFWEPQIKLNCLHRPTEQNIKIYLRGSWYSTKVKIGETFNLIGKLNFENECIVNDLENLVIINSDLLINSTQIASSYNCLRSSILQNKSMIIGSYTKPLIIGSFLHDLLEICLISNNFEDEFMTNQLDRLIRENGDQLYSANLSEEEISIDLTLGKQKLQNWSKKYINEFPKPNKFSKSSHRFENLSEEPSKFSITSAKSIEELIWSPKFGIKGKIDLIVELIRNDAQNNEKVNLIPLEFKTGKVGFNLNYEVQTMLYQLLISEKYQFTSELGLIFLLNGDPETDEQLIKIHSIRPRLIGLIQARNRLASYLGDVQLDGEGEEEKLPDMIKNKHICGRCNQLQSCMLTHKTFEDIGETSTNLMGIQSLYEHLTNHLTPTHLDFFKFWTNFLNSEESFIKIYKKDIWSKTSQELEEKGKCFSDMILVGYLDSSEWVNVIEFKKLDLTSQQQILDKSIISNLSLLETNTNLSISQPTPSKDPLPHTSMEIGDPVVISTESGIFGLAVGSIVEITSQSIKIALSKEFSPPLKKSPDFDNSLNQKFLKFSDYNEFIQSTSEQVTKSELFRIDKDEFEQGLKLIRGNLINLMTLMTPIAIRLRELIIDLKPPRLFKLNNNLNSNGDVLYSKFNSNGALNPDQEAACLSAINNEDYTLILGMPGTGKTTTTAHLVKYLIEVKNQSILITSYTHSSLDNILLKLINLGVTNFLRLGSLNKVHNNIKKYCINHPDNRVRSVAEAERIFGKTPIIATTCLGMNHFLFDKRKFDYTIIDEASQSTLPTSIAPLLVSNKFVLVGDHYQLPPLLRDQKLQREASNCSLFKILAERWPDSVSKIRYQYRMNFDIMKLCNKLIYSDSLHCGNDQIANSKLELSNPNWINNLHTIEYSAGCLGDSECWLKHCLNPTNSVIFLNTQKLKNHEVREGELIYNNGEISIINQLIISFFKSGLPLNKIGILSPYKKQTLLLQKRFEKFKDLEVLTIDKSQGRDKDLIIISLVRSNSTEKVGNLLKDWKRINVALTRSKLKLILIGDKGTLMGGTYLFRELINIMEADDKVFNLGTNCLDEHKLKALDGSSQFSGSSGISQRSEGGNNGSGGRNRTSSVKEFSQANSVLLREIGGDDL